MPDVDIPNEVASQSFLNQSTALSATTVFTPTSDSLLRVCLYINESGTNGFPAVTVSYTDPARGSSSISPPGPVGGTQGFVTVIRASANTAVQVSAAVPSAAYNLYVTVEQL